MSRRLAVEPLLSGACRAPALVLDAPLSFWGGVDPASGRIIDRQHPQRGVSISGRALVLPGIRGSTAAPGALLECLVAETGPAALLTARFEVVPVVTLLTGALLDVIPLPVGVLSPTQFPASLVTGVNVVVDGRSWRLASG